MLEPLSVNIVCFIYSVLAGTVHGCRGQGESYAFSLHTFHGNQNSKACFLFCCHLHSRPHYMCNIYLQLCNAAMSSTAQQCASCASSAKLSCIGNSLLTWIHATLCPPICQVYCIHTEPNYSLPWQRKRQMNSTSSGFIATFNGKRCLLTNAHSVDYHTQVWQEGWGRLHEAVWPDCM